MEGDLDVFLMTPSSDDARRGDRSGHASLLLPTQQGAFLALQHQRLPRGCSLAGLPSISRPGSGSQPCLMSSGEPPPTGSDPCVTPTSVLCTALVVLQTREDSLSRCDWMEERPVFPVHCGSIGTWPAEQRHL